jgi:hypothetical protein
MLDKFPLTLKNENRQSVEKFQTKVTTGLKSKSVTQESKGNCLAALICIGFATGSLKDIFFALRHLLEELESSKGLQLQICQFLTRIQKFRQYTELSTVHSENFIGIVPNFYC